MYPDKVQLLRFAVRSRSDLSCIIYIPGWLSLETITGRKSLPILLHISWHALQFSFRFKCFIPSPQRLLIFNLFRKSFSTPPLVLFTALIPWKCKYVFSRAGAISFKICEQMINPWRNKMLFLSREVDTCIPI